jgi:hypothetical protein
MYEAQVRGNLPPARVGSLVAIVEFGSVDRREYLCVRDWLNSAEVRAVQLVKSSRRLR